MQQKHITSNQLYNYTEILYKRFRVPFEVSSFSKTLGRPWFNIEGAYSLRYSQQRYEVKQGPPPSMPAHQVRRMGRGKVWDTIVEFCDDIPSETTLRTFPTTFFHTMLSRYESAGHDSPTSNRGRIIVSLESFGQEGLSWLVVIGFMNGVHVQWDM